MTLPNVTPAFFESQHVNGLSKYGSKRYKSSSTKDRSIGFEISDYLTKKTTFWAEAAQVDNYVANPRTKWQVMGHFLPYTWAQLYKRGDDDKGVYFTVGVDFTHKALVYKLDCQRKNPHTYTKKRIELTAKQVSIFDNLIKGSGAEWQQINSSDLSKWDWPKLIHATEEFIIKHDFLYESAISQVWNVKRGITPSVGSKLERIARICWNTNGWIRPSGRMGKSEAASHEQKYGFGHEEWLFDIEKTMGDYHYGFLEPVRKFQSKYIGQRFNFLLYTIDSKTNEKYWVGYLRDVIVIDSDEANTVLEEYKKNGWIQMMRKDLDSVGLDGSRIENEYLKEIDILNVKFKPDALKGLFEKPIPVAKDDKLITANRYILLNVEDGFDQLVIAEGKKGFNFESGTMETDDLAQTARRTFQQREIEFELKHNKLSIAFLKYLQGRYGNARRECDAFGGTKIDIVAKTEQGTFFYEVKTYKHLKTSIRVALGQLLEYAYYPDVQNAQKLLVVSDIEPDDEIRKYIKHLRSVLSLPVGYIQFDIAKNEIISEI